jgi:MgtC family
MIDQQVARVKAGHAPFGDRGVTFMLQINMDFLRAIGAGAAQINIILAVIVAMGLGAVIGYDREAADKPAGLRTHMLVAGAAALFVGLGTFIVQIYQQILGASPMTEAIRIQFACLKRSSPESVSWAQALSYGIAGTNGSKESPPQRPC